MGTSPLLLHAAPSAGFDQPFEMLGACHERVRRSLALLERLAAHLATRGADAQARGAAADVLRYFDRAAPAHHEDEERHVLPALRASGDATLVALADRLHDDHRRMAEAWAVARPSLADLALADEPARSDGSADAADMADMEDAVDAADAADPAGPADAPAPPGPGAWTSSRVAQAAAGWRAFAALYAGHMETEEATAFPAAAARARPADQVAMGREMAARRGAVVAGR